MSKDYNICILGGGWSNEREISLKSSQDVHTALLENKHNVVLYDCLLYTSPSPRDTA